VVYDSHVEGSFAWSEGCLVVELVGYEFGCVVVCGDVGVGA